MCMDKKVVKLTAQHNNKNSTIETCAHFQLNTAYTVPRPAEKKTGI